MFFRCAMEVRSEGFGTVSVGCDESMDLYIYINKYKIYWGVYISPWINDSHSPGTQSMGSSVSHVT